MLLLGGVVLQRRVAARTEGERHVGGLGQNSRQTGRVGVVMSMGHDRGQLDRAAVAKRGGCGRDGTRG